MGGKAQKSLPGIVAELYDTVLAWLTSCKTFSPSWLEGVPQECRLPQAPLVKEELGWSLRPLLSTLSIGLLGRGAHVP